MLALPGRAPAGVRLPPSQPKVAAKASNIAGAAKGEFHGNFSTAWRMASSRANSAGI